MTVPQPREHVDHGADAGDAVAVEDLDLAVARLSWAESCGCVRTTEQSAALRWHATQVSEARVRVMALCPDPGRGR